MNEKRKHRIIFHLIGKLVPLNYVTWRKAIQELNAAKKEFESVV